MHTSPSERLIPVLYSIETAVAVGYKLYPGLKDKDVEQLYDAFHTFFKIEAKGKTAPEPHSSATAKDTVIELIFQHLERAEDDGEFDNLLNGTFAPAGHPLTSPEELYVVAFNYLKKSARLWRKNVGARGYLKGPIRDLVEVSIEIKK